MERVPKPSNIPRPPRSTATRPAVQVQPSRLPTKLNSKVVCDSRVTGVGVERHKLDLEATMSQADAPGKDEAQSGDYSLAPAPTGPEQNEMALTMTTEKEARVPKEESISAAEKSIDVRRRPRPSLSERTVETLSQIPPSPSPRRRKSGFYPADMPGSCLSCSSSLRVESSERNFSQPRLPSTPRGPSPTKRQADSMTYSYSAKPSPSRRSVSTFVPRSLPRGSRGVYGANDLTPSKVPPVPKLPPNTFGKSLSHGVPNHLPLQKGVGSDHKSRQSLVGEDNGHEIGRHTVTKPQFGAHTYTPKSTRQRIPLDDLFSRQPSATPSGRTNRLLPGTHESSSKSGSKANAQPRSRVPSKEQPRISKDSDEYPAVSSVDLTMKKTESPKSSAALRETIAKAKEARRMAAKLGNHENLADKKNSQASFSGNRDITAELSDNNLLLKRMNVGRISGRLNIAALGLSEFPNCLKEMYNIENIDINSGEWYESVDLVRLMAADNEFEFLPSWAFPDISLQASTDLEEGNIFAGLQSIDLHGNNLSELPCGLKSLTRLTSINLSRNRLTNACIDILGQISSLQQLRLARNLLEGALSESVGSLVDLELLDLQDNSITDLGLALKDLTKMRSLGVAGNRLASIPSYIFECLSLDEIYAAANQLAGSLIPEGLTNLSALRTLDVSKNALTALSESERLDFLSLQDLNVTDNRLCTISDVSGWTRLITLCAGGNKLTRTPDGLTSLPNLKNLNLSRNSIIQLDCRLGLMDSLTSLEVGNNPLRERRQLSMTTDDLKQDLRKRLPASPKLANNGDEDVSNDLISMNIQGHSTEESIWPMKPGGVLDRSSSNLQDLEESRLELILQTTDIKSLIFHHNRLSCIPTALSTIQNTLTTLDLSHNCLTTDTYLPVRLSLPYLKNLDVSSNTIIDLSSLTKNLHAPLLTFLNVSYNRISSLPSFLSATYPSITTLLASNNSISTLDIDIAKGFHMLDLSENAIERLDPRLGLLASHGLRRLLVGGNRFRVPRREVLDRGTDALLSWLRGRIPAGEFGNLDLDEGEGKGERERVWGTWVENLMPDA